MLFRMPVKNGRRAMPCHFIIHAFCLLTLAFGSTLALAGEKPLTLSKALSRAMAQNPGLQVFDFRLQGLDGRRITADQNPALEAGLEVENFLGSDNLRGVDGAEYTLSLSSVLELGGKRQARVSVVDSRYGLVEAERRAETLDVLGQVAQRFVATLALQEKLELAAEAVALAEATHEIVTRRADGARRPRPKSCAPGPRSPRVVLSSPICEPPTRAGKWLWLPCGAIPARTFKCWKAICSSSVHPTTSMPCTSGSATAQPFKSTRANSVSAKRRFSWRAASPKATSVGRWASGVSRDG